MGNLKLRFGLRTAEGDCPSLTHRFFRLDSVENPHFWQNQPEVGHPGVPVKLKDLLPEPLLFCLFLTN